MTYVLPNEPVRLGLPRRALIGLVVRVASIMQRQQPARLRRLLTRIAAGAMPASYAQTYAIKEQVLTASPECRGSEACLTRSITIALLCRLRGSWPEWCVGVLMSPPFTAHAWVQAESRIVEDVLLTGDYRTFYTVSAGSTTSDGSDPNACPGKRQRRISDANEGR